MLEAPQTVSDELAAFLAQGISLLVGSCDASQRPHAARAVGFRLHPDRRHATIYLPEVTSRNIVTDVTNNPRIAVLASYPLDHRSLQLKGPVLATRPATEDERPLLQSYLATFASVLEVVGMPYEVVTMLSHWPAVAVELCIEELYDQTPGPGAGARLEGTSL